MASMTMISDWLRKEELDRSEPVTFYVPGAVKWDVPPLEVVVWDEIEVWEEED